MKSTAVFLLTCLPAAVCRGQAQSAALRVGAKALFALFALSLALLSGCSGDPSSDEHIGYWKQPTDGKDGMPVVMEISKESYYYTLNTDIAGTVEDDDRASNTGRVLRIIKLVPVDRKGDLFMVMPAGVRVPVKVSEDGDTLEIGLTGLQGKEYIRISESAAERAKKETLAFYSGKAARKPAAAPKAPSAIKKTPQKNKPAAAPQPKPKPTPQAASNRSVAPAVQDPAVNDTQAEDVSAPKNALAPNQARVVKASQVDKPIYREKETCKTVYKKSSSSSQNNIANSAAGVASGGLIGGTGQQQQQQQPARTSEYVCTTQKTRVNTIKGYQITYEYNGRTFEQWMEKHPGDVVEVDASGKALPPQ